VGDAVLPGCKKNVEADLRSISPSSMSFIDPYRVLCILTFQRRDDDDDDDDDSDDDFKQ
jgi:hypothetical protein